MSNVGTIGHEKTFVIPTFGVTATKELTTLMNPLSLAVAKETGQFDTVSQERRSAFVEILGHVPTESSDAVLRSKHAS